MKEILLNAFKACAMRYCKNDSSCFGRWEHLWDERLTVEQKAEEIAKELESAGYVLLKRVSMRVDDDLAVFNDHNGE
jgi:hypothetical protein